MSLPCSDWVVSGTSVSSTPRRWAHARSASRAYKDKQEPLARKLEVLRSTSTVEAQDPAAELPKVGGAEGHSVDDRPTATRSSRRAGHGLAVNGTLLLIGVAESMQVSPALLLRGCRSVKGWYSGLSIDSEDTLAFSVRTGVRV